MKITNRIKLLNVEEKINERIESLMEEAESTEEISEMIALLKDNYEMQSARPRCIKPDTLALIATNLLGILLILNYEKVNVISTKALTFILRGRV